MWKFNTEIWWRLASTKSSPTAQLEQKIDKLAEYVEDILRDQNDINDEVQMQLDNISEVIAELQVQNKTSQPRKRIGFNPAD